MRAYPALAPGANGTWTVAGAPQWSPDGTRLTINTHPTTLVRDERRGAFIVDVASGRLTPVAGVPAIHFGTGAIAQLSQRVPSEARVLLLYGGSSAERTGTLAEVRQALQGRTVLLMTHRLRAARAADSIVVVNDGRAVEQGSHDELLRLGGVYARLWRIQQLEAMLSYPCCQLTTYTTRKGILV